MMRVTVMRVFPVVIVTAAGAIRVMRVVMAMLLTVPVSVTVRMRMGIMRTVPVGGMIVGIGRRFHRWVKWVNSGSMAKPERYTRTNSATASQATTLGFSTVV